MRHPLEWVGGCVEGGVDARHTFPQRDVDTHSRTLSVFAPVDRGGASAPLMRHDPSPAGNSFEIAFATSKASLTVRVNNKCIALKLKKGTVAWPEPPPGPQGLDPPQKTPKKIQKKKNEVGI